MKGFELEETYEEAKLDLQAGDIGCDVIDYKAFRAALIKAQNRNIMMGVLVFLLGMSLGALAAVL